VLPAVLLADVEQASSLVDVRGVKSLDEYGRKFLEIKTRKMFGRDGQIWTDATQPLVIFS
jgi:hypothetical protein